MRYWRSRQPIIILALSIVLLLGRQAGAEQPTRFTFTPTFRDPDPGKRQWERWGETGYREILPSGRSNLFRVQKQATVKGMRGSIIQKLSEPDFFVFIPDSTERSKELWWWRSPGPWNLLGKMRDVVAPQRIDPG
jgi:hypothetical protein